MSQLKDRNCLVTGASGGIGIAVAISLANHGANVFVQGRDAQSLEKVFNSLPTVDRQQHHIIIADFGTREGVQTLCNEVKALTDHLDVVILNASVQSPPKPFQSIPIDEFERVMRINLKAPFMICQQLLPLLRKGCSPSIIIVTSSVGHKTKETRLASRGAYAVSKFGLEGLTWLIADELKQEGIRVNAICIEETQSSEMKDQEPENEATGPFLFLSRADTVVTNEMLTSKNWLNCDPWLDTSLPNVY